jgi:hypothetical protein
MNMLLHWEYLIAGRPRDHKGWDGNGGIPAQHTPVNGSREIGRGVGYRKYSEQLSGYPTIQSSLIDIKWPYFRSLTTYNEQVSSLPRLNVGTNSNNRAYPSNKEKNKY